MTDYQNELVMEHLDLVNWVIRTRISVPNRPLLTYDDFYAIGCEAICRAALKYQADSGEFAPFACRYIYNAIIDHCRAMNYRLQRSVDAGFEEGEVLFDLLAHTTVDFEAEVTDDSAMAALRACRVSDRSGSRGRSPLLVSRSWLLRNGGSGRVCCAGLGSFFFSKWSSPFCVLLEFTQKTGGYPPSLRKEICKLFVNGCEKSYCTQNAIALEEKYRVL